MLLVVLDPEHLNHIFGLIAFFFYFLLCDLDDLLSTDCFSVGCQIVLIKMAFCVKFSPLLSSPPVAYLVRTCLCE